MMSSKCHCLQTTFTNCHCHCFDFTRSCARMSTAMCATYLHDHNDSKNYENRSRL